MSLHRTTVDALLLGFAGQQFEEAVPAQLVHKVQQNLILHTKQNTTLRIEQASSSGSDGWPDQP